MYQNLFNFVKIWKHCWGICKVMSRVKYYLNCELITAFILVKSRFGCTILEETYTPGAPACVSTLSELKSKSVLPSVNQFFLQTLRVSKAWKAIINPHHGLEQDDGLIRDYSKISVYIFIIWKYSKVLCITF